jgi:hypothetical protein
LYRFKDLDTCYQQFQQRMADATTASKPDVFIIASSPKQFQK